MWAIKEKAASGPRATQGKPMNPDYFLVSSFDPIPQNFLQGLCFQGEDLIIGDGGYQKYRAATGADIQTGQDGSYIVVRTSDAETVIGTD
jgi:hypothetical protein